MSRRVTYPEAADYLGVRVGTLRSWVSRREVPHVRLGARLVVFDLEHLDAHLAAHAVPAASAARRPHAPTGRLPANSEPGQDTSDSSSNTDDAATPGGAR